MKKYLLKKIEGLKFDESHMKETVSICINDFSNLDKKVSSFLSVAL